MYYLEFFSELYRRKIKYLLVGGLSVNLYGVPRVTQDIDIIISLDKENILNLVSLLKNLNYIPRLPVNPEDLADPQKREAWIREKNLTAFSFYHQKEHYKVVNIVLVHPLDFLKAYHQKTVKFAKDVEIYLVSLDDLISMKTHSGRDQDKSDIDLLKRMKSLEGIDNE